MKRIFEYTVPITDSQTIRLPYNARPFCVQLQHGEPQVWAIVDDEEGLTDYHFHWVGTGHPFHRDGVYAMTYVGTVQLADGGLVFHLFYSL